jgi:hypothetical protein
MSLTVCAKQHQDGQFVRKLALSGIIVKTNVDIKFIIAIRKDLGDLPQHI